MMWRSSCPTSGPRMARPLSVHLGIPSPSLCLWWMVLFRTGSAQLRTAWPQPRQCSPRPIAAIVASSLASSAATWSRVRKPPQRLGRDVQVGRQLVQVPTQTGMHAGAFRDQVLAAIDQHFRAPGVSVEPRDGTPSRPPARPVRLPHADLYPDDSSAPDSVDAASVLELAFAGSELGDARNCELEAADHEEQ
jgi:hypothetical protein